MTVQDNATYVRYVHACLGYPSSSTFLRAVTLGFITGTEQFPRLTAKMVRRHLPNALATAKGHLDRTRANPPNAASDAVSARRRHHARANRKSEDQPTASRRTQTTVLSPSRIKTSIDPRPCTWIIRDPCQTHVPLAHDTSRSVAMEDISISSLCSACATSTPLWRSGRPWYSFADMAPSSTGYEWTTNKVAHCCRWPNSSTSNGNSCPHSPKALTDQRG